MYSPSWLRLVSLVLFCLCVTLAGCNSSKNAKAKVKGKVKFGEKTLTAGTVSFFAKDNTGRVGSATIDAQGNYEMADAPVGLVTITVKVPKLGMGPTGKIEAPKAPKGVPEMRPPGGDSKLPPPSIDPKTLVLIPEKYDSVEKSGLTYTVEKGEQTKDITLSP